ncbi:magnesium transporter [Teredinibacter sp. KSP-S5-2]|uniref:magnesium transporter n=1 Tax=Teredinibacter sp. KSP-S5-2 TaxID=3034506 RepID=UPI0029342332|nr:magnesium transporter [Teredinibacter sp. KSP-S5-2]WNO09996.1 magnesium transporter [Teredinibacter sp. KSP-S5-2]
MSFEDFSELVAKITDTVEDFDKYSDEVFGPPAFVYLIDEAINLLAPEQLALLLESMPSLPRKFVFQQLSVELQNPIFLAMQEESRRSLITQLDMAEIEGLLNTFDAEALLELAEELPDHFLNEAYKKLDSVERERFERASKYSAEMAGHWVNFEFPIVYHNLKVMSAVKLLKRSRYAYVESIYLSDRQNRLIGEVAIADLLSAEPNMKLADIATEVENVIHAEDDMDQVADEVIQSNRMVLPVVESDGSILGRMLLTTAFEHREEMAEQQISVAGGLAEDEDLFAPVWRSSKNRALWLGINLLTAFLASWCIGLFEATLQQVVALAILMPIVASMGGISGSQTLTVIVRALALGKITDGNRRMVLHKELRVGIVNGVLWALIIGISVNLWFADMMLGFTIALAILVNIVIAVVSGVLIPSLLDKFEIDPALSGSVVLTTVTDIVGFVVFLGAGAIILT